MKRREYAIAYNTIRLFIVNNYEIGQQINFKELLHKFYADDVKASNYVVKSMVTVLVNLGYLSESYEYLRELPVNYSNYINEKTKYDNIRFKQSN
ncbi:hypothetical protein BF503P1_00036 [Bacteroides phage BF503P1]|nr:hypothetical protein BF503P1_00036 [Bacteroides phage BF503P1]WAX07090.1 hypothetical protein BF503P4_00022 [Bacteroides phage BF503P4]